MKNSILALFLALSLASCTKQEELARPQETAPIVNSVTWSPAYAGSSMSILFKVNLTVTNPITRMNLYVVPETLRSYVKDPITKSGTYTMYDHMVESMPVAQAFVFYFLEFKMADGTTIRGEQFQVY